MHHTSLLQSKAGTKKKGAGDDAKADIEAGEDAADAEQQGEQNEEQVRRRGLAVSRAS